MFPTSRCLSLGAISGLLALGVVLTGCKEKPQGAKVAPRVEKAPEKTLSPSTEKWVDVLKESDRLALQNGAQMRGNLLRLSGRSLAKIRDSAGQNDGAVRLVALMDPGSTGPSIAARIQDSGSRYVLSVSSETTLRLAQVLGNGEELPLKDFTLPRPLSPGQPYELELRAVGSRLTAKVNGEKVGEVTENSLSTGMMQVSLDVAQPVLIGTLQYLPLGNSAPISTGATEQWINVLDDSNFLSKNPGIKKVDDGIAISGWTNLLPKAARNCAVRLTLENSLRTSPLRVSLRSSREGQYSLSMRTTHGLAVRRYVAATKDDYVIIEQPLPSNTAQSEEVVVEFRAVGPRISVKVNGEELQATEDTSIKEGQIGLGASKQGIEEYGEPKVKKLEYVVLD